ncbi:acyl-CoA/acyl-ACP dehydrogenase [Antrihabitans sp. YC3-6]|uniref:Acyl-[acyl-carrier-protein] dehydrogenase MbtN n=1 Tax=Antrihabitans stalagmiti TaxID=2799499 RepID=A0A934U1G8_9NOCA|nr:acyl-CoA dehydrogenase family protein [Antrihabitans stalagmiti]MBJ8338102.1 acyl-CoA/acyl-ACP dehydrogenase [Antrihabitans stalagmiti]
MKYAGIVGDAERARLDKIIGAAVDRYGAEAERLGIFPHGLVKELAAEGLFRQRWPQEPAAGDPILGLLIAERVANRGMFGIAVGLSLQLETCASALRRFGNTAEHERLLNGLLDGDTICAFGASEPVGGSDLLGIETRITPLGDGRIRVTGEKKYLSLGEVCDVAIILGKYVVDGSQAPLLTTVIVPSSALTTVKRHNKTGTSCLDTSWVRVDAELGAGAILGRVGGGLAVASWALMHERLSIVAQLVGGCKYALGLAVSHARQRKQFGTTLINHQALRLRLAELAAQVTMAELAVYGVGERLATGNGCNARDVAGLKVTTARLGERVMSECMHIFGGSGYLEDETPMSRLWRDARLARLGGGSDEMMLEMVAGGLQGEDRYSTDVRMS